ncbi:MAG: DNA-3-methyladenine glycosylase [Gemmataceae bacterium]|nr:DNA-3-methyladenine glycosylase [Gemmataceae bacterium]MDW8266300.1 DNA-3-methyladenine glycosylase [Gemmataceae bacterium]
MTQGVPTLQEPAEAFVGGWPARYAVAQRHLARRDPVLRSIIQLVGHCTLRPDAANPFALLVRSIISQQISTRAAEAIRARLERVLGAITPQALAAVSDDVLRAAGLSRPKLKALRDLTEKVQIGVVPLDHLHQWSDDDVIASLLPVRGIGRWTAQMFLIFGLGRLDVLPVDDYGLRCGVQKHYGLGRLPSKGELLDLAEPWRPYCTVATWYIWRSLGTVPQST